MDRPAQILIVDDDPRNLKLLEALLAPEGYAVTSAASGEAALACIQESLPDVVLLDVMMPGIDGLEVTRRLRANELTRLLPIVLVTALRETEDRIRGIEAGCDDFISKPFDRLEVLARIRNLLQLTYYRGQVNEKEKFDYVVDQIRDGIVVLDPQLRVTRISRHAAQLLNMDPDALGMELPVHLQRHFQLAADAAAALAKDWRRGPWMCDLARPEIKAAEPLILCVRSSMVRSPAGEIINIVLIVQDVTEERRQDILKETFLDLVSHKLRTPITVLQMVGGLLQEGDGGELNETQRQMVANVVEQSKAMGELVEKLLVFTSIRGHDFMPADGVVPVGESLKRLLDRLKARQLRVPLTYELACGEGCRVRMETRHFELVMHNLFDNAVKFADKVEAALRVSATASDSTVTITVADNGRGIAPEMCERVFDKFYQVDKERTGNVEGVGLGLPLVKHLVTAYGGSVTLESQLSVGTNVTIKLLAAP